MKCKLCNKELKSLYETLYEQEIPEGIPIYMPFVKEEALAYIIHLLEELDKRKN